MLGECKPGGQVWGVKVDKGLGMVSPLSMQIVPIFKCLSSHGFRCWLAGFLEWEMFLSLWDPLPYIKVTAVLPAPRPQTRAGLVQMAQGFLLTGPRL